MSAQKHVHKLKKIKYKSGNVSFFCVLDCSYKISQPLALGKETICWRCGQPFKMTEYTLRLVKPHCEACHKPKKEVAWIHEPNEIEKAATKEIAKEVSLMERLNQSIQQTQKDAEEDI